uniref:NADH dehydrogenase subunit 4L n=1 Tax=Stroggylocephalus agrestis TaxID=3112133 RepID=UPI002E76001E|nr:NADH dehydrogenase subunit 4L [Stroggylocephalus agrestis]WRK21280.1 NADH dehydrogenase subunit 4L [Stroggylocephalus agrestis]
MIFFVLVLFFFSLISLVNVRKHILLCLMSLEFIVLSILFTIFIFSLMYSNSFYIYVFFMTFFVCEGVLGLSVLVLLVRFHGNDYLSSFYMW